MPVVFGVAAAAVLIGVIAVAMGRGGEMAFFQSDYAPLKLDEISAPDVALFRPPSALWGYSMQATDEALTRIATAITERDVEISALRQQVADLEASAVRRRSYGKPEPAGRPDPAPATAPPVQDAPAEDTWDRRPPPPTPPPSGRAAPLSAPPGTKSRPPWDIPEPGSRGRRDVPAPGSTPSATGWAALPKRPAEPEGPAGSDALDGDGEGER